MQIQNPYVQYMYSYPHKTAYRELKNVEIKAFFDQLIGKKNSLYFHIPFCQYKCGYCNLFSLAGQSKQMMKDYVKAMETQVKQLSQALPKGAKFADLTIGGGTPLSLPEDLLERIFELAREYFLFEQEKVPIIVETSPNQTTKSKLNILKKNGVTRISIGVQSFKQEELIALSRFHTVEAAKNALELIRAVGFSCVNIDLIYGIPGQTKESIKYSIEQVLLDPPEELFVYPLYVKEGTGLYRQKISQEKETYALYQWIREKLIQEGYYPCSMRRFVRKDTIKETAKHSLCGFGNTISIGCGGRSYIGNLHFCTPYAVKQEQCMKIVKAYMEKEDYLQVNYGFLLNEEEQKRRYVIKHILFDQGILKEDYQQHFGTEVEKDFPLLKNWEENGYAIHTPTCITLTEKGFSLSDYLGPQLISTTVLERMKEWSEEDARK